MNDSDDADAAEDHVHTGICSIFELLADVAAQHHLGQVFATVGVPGELPAVRAAVAAAPINPPDQLRPARTSTAVYGVRRVAVC